MKRRNWTKKNEGGRGKKTVQRKDEGRCREEIGLMNGDMCYVPI